MNPHRFYRNQPRLLRQLLVGLRPHWRRDSALPLRLEATLRRDRRCGSRDRRLYRELAYTALRYLPWIEPLLDEAPGRLEATLAWLSAETPSTAGFRRALTADWPPCPPGVSAKAAFLGTDPDAVLPAWFRDECPEAFEARRRDALLRRAPLWIRLQIANSAGVLAEFQARGWTWRESELAPGALALPAEADLVSTDAYLSGRVEIQDLGSQLILAAVGPQPGGRWLDACAGAGGKALQLSGLLGPNGRVEAHDVRSEALDEMEARAARAGLGGRIVRTDSPQGPYDGVLIDAPCSGSGTWRRAPHLKWTTQPAQIAACARRQRALLKRFAPLVRRGGRLVYATCSLARAENEAVAEAFRRDFPDFEPAAFARTFRGEARGPGLLFWPDDHDGDGFYVASFEKK